jgi:hypothetical protein
MELPDTFTIGRNQLLKVPISLSILNDLLLPKDKQLHISRNHFEIQYKKQQNKHTYWLVNKSKINGTALNSTVISEVDVPEQLSHGDKIGILFKRYVG